MRDQFVIDATLNRIQQGIGPAQSAKEAIEAADVLFGPDASRRGALEHLHAYVAKLKPGMATELQVAMTESLNSILNEITRMMR
jgi:hypothetical protein